VTRKLDALKDKEQKQELSVLSLLAQAWNAFVELPEEHSADRHEFMHAIHAAQNIVFARIGKRNVEGRND
jgi:hypothetical protein